jgi:hypothetical protein
MLKTKTPGQIKKGGELLASIMALPKEAKLAYVLTASEVAVILGHEVKEIHRARQDQDEIIDAGGKLDRLSLHSIPAALVNKKYRYQPAEVEAYLKAIEDSMKVKVIRIAKATAAPALGFQSWLAQATPLETWPFSIQPGGRPMDICAAIALGKTTGKAVRLTIREFATALSDAASRSFHNEEAREIKRISKPKREPKKPDEQKKKAAKAPKESKAPEDKEGRKSRWDEPGGPI